MERLRIEKLLRDSLRSLIFSRDRSETDFISSSLRKTITLMSKSSKLLKKPLDLRTPFFMELLFGQMPL
jgi:hypothetical protein